jgi:hypothetical protein
MKDITTNHLSEAGNVLLHIMQYIKCQFQQNVILA